MVGKPRLVYRFNWQSTPQYLDLDVDTDFAGCKATRMSTSGGVALYGGHCLRHWSKTQTTIALSSGEAELGGIAQGMSQGLGMQAIAQDLGIKIALRLQTDATAAIGMSRRLGVGKIRHLDVSLLWVQHQVRNGRVALEKIPSSENPGAAVTKYLGNADLAAHMQRMTIEFQQGRAASAPQLTTSVNDQYRSFSKIFAELKKARGLPVDDCTMKTTSSKGRGTPHAPHGLGRGKT